MIRFLVKSAFLIGTISLLVPGFDSNTESESAESLDLVGSIVGAQAAISDLAGFCERAPAACETGGNLAAFAGARIEAGIATAYRLASESAPLAPLVSRSSETAPGAEEPNRERMPEMAASRPIDPGLLAQIAELDIADLSKNENRADLLAAIAAQPKLLSTLEAALTGVDGERLAERLTHAATQSPAPESHVPTPTRRPAM